jgi:hypothetical protein
MRCAEFLHLLNETLDQRHSALSDDLAEHLAVCVSCRNDWQKLKSCANLLREKSHSMDGRFTDKVIEMAMVSRQLRRRQQSIVWLSYAATIAASVLILGSVFTLGNNETSTDYQPAPPTLVKTHSQPSKVHGFENAHDERPDWHTFAKQLPDVREIWIETWSNSQSASPLTGSVTSGLRPVAITMTSAIKVIGQRILPTHQTPPADDGQAAGNSISSTLV